MRLYIEGKRSALLIYPSRMMVRQPQTVLLTNCDDYITESGAMVFGVICQTHKWMRKQQYDFLPATAVEKEMWKEDILLAIECAKGGLDFFVERRRRRGDLCLELTAKCQEACAIL